MDEDPNDVIRILLRNRDGVGTRKLKDVDLEADLVHYGYIAPNTDEAPALSNETHQTR